MGDAAVLAVLRSRLDPRLKKVAVSFAHHANHGTLLAWCSIETVAGYWGVSGRWVQIVVRELERLGLLVLVGDRKGGRGQAALYRIDVAALDRLPGDGHSAAFPPYQGRTGVRPWVNKATEPVGEALRTHRHLRTARVLCRADATPLTESALSEAVRRAAHLANLRCSGPHMLRHTFCSHLAMKGVPVRAIQELAGHRDLSTTQRYMHLSPAAVEDAIRLLNRPKTTFGFGDILETEDPAIGKVNG